MTDSNDFDVNLFFQENDKENWQRFCTELEVLHSLANPSYLNFLAISGYLQDARFLAFLKYLQYWKKENYRKYILYPIVLEILDMLLSSEEFRENLKDKNIIQELDFQITCQWLMSKNDRQ